MRRLLVVAQVADSFVVLTAAALFVQNLARSSSVSPGFDTRHTVRADAYLPPGSYKDNRSINLYISRAVEELGAIPGVDAAAAARTLPSQIGAALMGSAGVLALLLAVIRVYGVLAYTIASRTREIGIRVAQTCFGEAPTAKLVLVEVADVLAAGVAIGLAVAPAATRPIAMFFVAGLSPSDPASFLAVTGVLVVTGGLAAIGPSLGRRLNGTRTRRLTRYPTGDIAFPESSGHFPWKCANLPRATES